MARKANHPEPSFFDQPPASPERSANPTPEERTPLDASSIPPLDRKPLLLLMDGHAMVFRAWFALQKMRPLTIRSTGEDVRGVYSFTTTFFRMLTERKPTHVAIAFDLPGPTFRHDQFPEYKGTRPETPPELIQNVERVKQVMRVLRIPVLEVPRYEADDVLGAISSWATEEGIDTLISTGDTDLLQLVTPHTNILLTTGFGDTKVYDVDAVRERYGGLDPTQQRDVKALTGDTSDNIPGVPGVGVKTAIKLIQEFGSVESLLESLDLVTPPRIQGLVRDHSDQLVLSKQLVTIDTSVATGFDLGKARFGQYFRDEVLDVFSELEFSSLVPRIPASLTEQPHTEEVKTSSSETELSITLVDTPEALDSLAQQLRTAPAYGLEVVTATQRAMEAPLVGIAVATDQNAASYIPLGHTSPGFNDRQLPVDQVLETIGPLLREKAVTGHNLNFSLTVLANYGVAPTSVQVAFDTMIAAHLTGQKALGLKALAFNRLNLEISQAPDLTGTGKKQTTFDVVSITDATTFAATNAAIALRLEEALEADLQRDGLSEYNRNHALPLVPVLAQMQVHGIGIDETLLAELNEEISSEIEFEQKASYGAVGHEFNINSPAQLGELLFNELKLPSGRRTQSGYSTDASILENLRPVHPVIQHVLRYRELAKLKSTYVDTLPASVNPRTQRIHTSYNQAGSATGRLASSDPNLQNIPIRSALGLRVREAFIANRDPERIFLSADYSQIDLRALAHLSQDPELMAAFERDEDIHASTASLIYDVPLEEVTRDMRRLAKVMNFGVAYGLSAFGISQQTELTREEGAAFIESYFGTYPRVKVFLEEVVSNARDNGYAETLLGRRRYIPELQSPHYPVRQAGERIALNMPVQGTSADIINEAMVGIQKRLEGESFESRMLLQVHDELVFELPPYEEHKLSAMLNEVMPHAIEMSVPVKIDIKTGANWASMTYET